MRKPVNKQPIGPAWSARTTRRWSPTRKRFAWEEHEQPNEEFTLPQGADSSPGPSPLPPADIPIVAFDFGIKYNILRCLRRHGFKVQVVPATTTAEEVLSYQPAGLFLSNGPGRPGRLGLCGTQREGACGSWLAYVWDLPRPSKCWVRRSEQRPSSSNSAIAVLINR